MAESGGISWKMGQVEKLVKNGKICKKWVKWRNKLKIGQKQEIGSKLAE